MIYKLIKFNLQKQFDSLNLFITKIGVRINSPILCSISWKLSMFRYNFKKKIRRKNILVLYRAIGTTDFEDLEKKSSKKLSIFYFPRIQIKIIFNHFFKNLNNLIGYTNYSSKNAIIENKKILYRSFLIKILKNFNKNYKFNSMVNFNLRFYEDRELQEASKQCNIKFVCLHKESLIFPGELKYYQNTLKKYGKFKGDLILVYNQFFKKMIVSSHIVEAKKVKIIGMPRADYYYKLKKKKEIFFLVFLINPNRNVLFIKESKLHKKLKKNIKEIQWDNLSYLTIINTLNFAKLNPNIKFVFKSKALLIEDLKNKKYFQERLVLDSKLKNCKLILGGDSRKLIKDSKAIIGFNSTALVEGLILKKKIIMPYFGIKKKSIMKNFILNLSNSVFYAKNKKIFNKLLEKISKGKLKKSEINKRKLSQIISNYIGNIDGESTKRLKNYLL